MDQVGACNGTPEIRLYDRFAVEKSSSYCHPEGFVGGKVECARASSRRSREVSCSLEEVTWAGSSSGEPDPNHV